MFTTYFITPHEHHTITIHTHTHAYTLKPPPPPPPPPSLTVVMALGIPNEPFMVMADAVQLFKYKTFRSVLPIGGRCINLPDRVPERFGNDRSVWERRNIVIYFIHSLHPVSVSEKRGKGWGCGAPYVLIHR